TRQSVRKDEFYFFETKHRKFDDVPLSCHHRNESVQIRLGSSAGQEDEDIGIGVGTHGNATHFPHDHSCTLDQCTIVQILPGGSILGIYFLLVKTKNQKQNNY